MDLNLHMDLLLRTLAMQSINIIYHRTLESVHRAALGLVDRGYTGGDMVPRVGHDSASNLQR
jgi:hypothetical protein